MENKEKEKVKLDQVLKFLFSTSHKVLVNLLNGVFNENFDYEEVELNVTNNEFIEDSMEILRGDMFFDIVGENKSVGYHIEFQTLNDSSMVIRMFEYGFRKGKEKHKHCKDDEGVKTIYIPKQKVIFFEQNKNIKETLNLRIVFPDGEEKLYSVDVMKYWEYTDKDLIEKKMYPLLPLQLFKLRKDLESASKKNDLERINKLADEAKILAEKLANESKELFKDNEILGEDFHKMLLGIQNLIEYFNRNYFKDDNIEEEMIAMTKTLYDPEVEKRGIEKIILKLLTTKFKDIPSSYMDNISKMSEEKLELLAVGILEVKEVDDLKKYF